jgi:ketosteroid isomerase-like protein
LNKAATRSFVLCAVLLLTAAGCTVHSTHICHSAACPYRPAPGQIHADIEEVLQGQADRWNEGDIAGYMEPYWHSPELTFSAGGKVTRGFEPTLNHFRTAYPDRAAMGKLTFSDLEITPVCSDAAMVLGRWRLDATPPKSGAFSLVMRRIEGSWVIIHDHTSRDAS